MGIGTYLRVVGIVLISSVACGGADEAPQSAALIEVRASDGSASLSAAPDALPKGVRASDLKVTKITPGGAADKDVIAVYRLEPDGAQFTKPVTFNATLPQQLQPPTPGAIPLVIVISGERVEIPDTQEVKQDTPSSNLNVGAELTHFSVLRIAWSPVSVEINTTTQGPAATFYVQSAITYLTFGRSMFLSDEHWFTYYGVDEAPRTEKVAFVGGGGLKPVGSAVNVDRDPFKLPDYDRWHYKTVFDCSAKETTYIQVQGFVSWKAKIDEIPSKGQTLYEEGSTWFELKSDPLQCLEPTPSPALLAATISDRILVHYSARPLPDPNRGNISYPPATFWVELSGTEPRDFSYEWTDPGCGVLNPLSVKGERPGPTVIQFLWAYASCPEAMRTTFFPDLEVQDGYWVYKCSPECAVRRFGHGDDPFK